MAGHLRPTKLFTDWIKLITELKAGWSYPDYSASWILGAGMLLRTGCTTVADIEAIPQLLPAMWQATPLRVFSFLEMIGITERRSPATVLKEVTGELERLADAPCPMGLSPHAPYSTIPALLQASAALARKKRLRTCIHIAESALEFQMFARARGAMFKWIRRSGRDMSDCGNHSPVSHVASCRMLGDHLLAVHVNYLARGDAALLGQAGVHVVHCPRSHEYFGHAVFPLERLRRAGVNVCLGTDSLASVLKSRRETVRLSMFDEMQALLRARPSLRPRTALRMATVAGAKALGLPGKIGELTEGAYADLIAVPVAPTGDVTEAVVHYRGDIAAGMINGAWVVAPRDLNAGSRQ